MPVYVDSLKSCIPNKNWKWNKSCHLLADSEEELHAFALKIGMKRAWFQNKSSLPHYDLNANRRSVAVKLGAIEITNKQVVEMIRKHREKQKEILVEDKPKEKELTISEKLIIDLEVRKQVFSLEISKIFQESLEKIKEEK